MHLLVGRRTPAGFGVEAVTCALVVSGVIFGVVFAFVVVFKFAITVASAVIVTIAINGDIFGVSLLVLVRAFCTIGTCFL